MKTGNILVAVVVLILITVASLDWFYVRKFEGRFTELEKQRIVISNKLATAKIVYENLNPMLRPGTTLEQVVNTMAEYAAPDVFFLSAGRLTPDEIKIDERYANTIVIMNLATRADVERLLGVLPAVASDIDRQLESEPANQPTLNPVATPSQGTATTSSTDARSMPVVLIVSNIVKMGNNLDRSPHLACFIHAPARIGRRGQAFTSS